MKYLSVVSVFLLVYIVSQIIPRPIDAWFYVTQSLWSLLIIFALFYIQKSNIVFTVCVLEMLHIIVNFITCFYYLGGNYSTHLIYVNYPLMLDILDSSEAIILFIGAPWSGVFNGLKRLSHSFIDSFGTSNRGI